MNVPERHYAPVVLGLWMIALPIVFWFFAGAGAGTVFDWFAQLLATFFSIYGGSSAIVGVIFLLWSAWRAWRSGDFAFAQNALND